MSTTWYITKEYLKRLEINFEEKGRKTFNLFPYGPPETDLIVCERETVSMHASVKGKCQTC
jgi:hypothetical protein